MKDKRISIRVTEEEKKHLENIAYKKGYNSLSEMIRANLDKTVELNPIRENCIDESAVTSERLYIRVTKEEKLSIQENAKKAGLNVSRYVRHCCTCKSLVIIPDMKELGKELNRVGVNLNQIARLCNQGLIDCPDISETKEVMKGIYKELTKLMKKSQPGR